LYNKVICRLFSLFNTSNIKWIVMISMINVFIFIFIIIKRNIRIKFCSSPISIKIIITIICLISCINNSTRLICMNMTKKTIPSKIIIVIHTTIFFDKIFYFIFENLLKRNEIKIRDGIGLVYDFLKKCRFRFNIS